MKYVKKTLINDIAFILFLGKIFKLNFKPKLKSNFHNFYLDFVYESFIILWW